MAPTSNPIQCRDNSELYLPLKCDTFKQGAGDIVVSLVIHHDGLRQELRPVLTAKENGSS